MGAEPVQSPDPARREARRQQLAAAVRAVAATAADQAGGGLALVFARSPEDPNAVPRLRAAAGFGSAEAARGAAETLLPQVAETLDAGGVGSFAAASELGARAAGGLVMHPLGCEGRTHGVLVVGSPQPLDPAQHRELSQTAELLSLRLDHAFVADAYQSADTELSAIRSGSDEKSEEVLKLSEALFAQDIELLRSQERLGKIEKLKNDFIERMSRELRTPLNSIIEAIISVMTGENEALSDGAKQTLRSALDDGTGFLRTLQNILDLWRIKQAELPVEIQDINFRETVDEAIFSVQDAIGDRPLTIETQIDEHFPKIRTDLTKINQILFLLLENAVKFTPTGKVTISARVEEDELLCSIEDTGVGICHDDQHQIFEEFYQVDEPASQRYRGAGLGLPLVRDLLLLLDGNIAVTSEVGSGSCFTFTLPVQVTG